MRILYISPSMLTKASFCDTQAVLSTLGYGSAEVSTPATIGGLFHEAFARHLKGGFGSDLGDFFEVSYLEAEEEGLLGDTETRDSDYSLENLRRILAEWCYRSALSKLPFRVNATEVSFNLPIGTISASDGEPVEVRIIGILDANVTNRDDSGVWVVEHKTTRKRLDSDYFAEFRYSPQTGAYIYALSEMRKMRVDGCYINAVSMRELPSSERKCKEHGVTYAECGNLHLKSQWFPLHRSSDDLAEWRRQALETATDYLNALKLLEAPKASGNLSLRNIDGVRQQGRFRNACARCDFYGFCAAGRDTSLELPPQREYHRGNRMRSGLFMEPQTLEYDNEQG